MAIDFKQFAEQARGALGENLVAFVLYGSHARGEAVPGSDINLFLLVSDSRPQSLEGLIPLIPGWLKQGATPPVIFEANQLVRSHDTFALELAEMAATHTVLWGEDPFAGYVPDWRAVRNELEHESRQKTIYLKRRWLASGGKEEALRALIRETVPGYLALLRGAILLKRQSLTPVISTDLFAEMQRYCEWFDPRLWARLRAAAHGQEKLATAELNEVVRSYIEQARSFVRYVDLLTGE